MKLSVEAQIFLSAVNRMKYVASGVLTSNLKKHA